MQDIMDVKNSPDGLGRTGVRRLNKLPIIIALTIVLFTAMVMVHAVYKRGRAVREARQGAVAAMPGDKGTENAARSIVKGRPDGVIEAAEDPAPFDSDPIPEEDNSAGAVYLPPTERETRAAMGLQPMNDPATNGIEEEKERIAKMKREIYAQALTSGSEVQAGTGLQNTAFPGVHGASPQTVDSGLSRISQSLQRALGGLTEAQAAGADMDPNMQARKESFLEREGRAAPYLPFKREHAISPFEVKSGAVIPALMISGINSDLPGQIIAQVSQNVYDTASGGHLLIPQGTKLVGIYDSRVAYGQKRVLIAWNRLIFPDASTLELGVMPGADGAGYAGFKDQVDNHYFRIFGNAFLLSLITAGFQLSQPDDMSKENDAQEQIAAAMGQHFGQVGMEMTQRNMNVQPTVKIRPGYRFNVMVNKDIALERPYQ